MSDDSLTIIDNRTGKHYEVPIIYGTYSEYGASINTMDLREIKATETDFGLLTYDPGFGNTCSCKSSVTFIDGEKGILQYRGYPIDEIARQSTFMETSYLILNGELPTTAELELWTHRVDDYRMIHENIKKFIDGFHYDAHPMGVLVGTVGALSTFYPDAKDVFSDANRQLQIWRILGKLPTMAAFAYRHSRGLPFTYPDDGLSYTGNFLNMMFRKTEIRFEPDPILERAMDVLFMLHADHEQNCSTSSMRVIGSSLPDPYSALAGAAAALYGPLHGGANEAVLRMLDQIGGVDRVPEFIEGVKAGTGGRLMGFGHRVYKNYDPRATIIKEMAHQVFEVTGTDPKLEVALELERIALEDDYFVSRKLYPNVDFYSGIIYRAMGFPTDMFPVLFALGRAAGWLAQWQELIGEDEHRRIARPRQIYTGHEKRSYVPIEDRTASKTAPVEVGV